MRSTGIGTAGFWAAAALAFAVLASCTPAHPPAATEPALWRIRDADSEIWLFGTAHVLRPDQHWRGPRFDQAFGSAGELVLEADTGAPDQIRAEAQRNGTLPPGETLASKLDADGAAQLQRVTASLHIDPAVLEHDRPWYAALILSVTYVASRGEDLSAGVENTLLTSAHRRKMRVDFLETPEQQILALADLAPADEALFLKSIMREIEHDDGSEAATADAWARGDVGKLTTLLSHEFHDAGPAYYNAVIARRNAVWADAITERLNGSGHSFIAVGAAHLVGPDGVIALLRARGIHVDGP